MLSNSYSAEYRRPRRRRSSRPSAARTSSTASSFYDFNSNELNARTYAQTLNGVSRDDPNADTHDYRYGFSLGGPIITNRTFFFGNYEGSRLKALGGGAQAVVPTAAMRGGDFSGDQLRRSRSADRPAVPRQPHSRRTASIRRRGTSSTIFYPLPNQPNTATGGYGAYRADPAARPQPRPRRRAHRSRADQPRLALRARQLAAPRSRRVHVREHRRQRRRRPHQPRPARSRVAGHRRWPRAGRASGPSTIVNEFRGGYSEDARNRRSQFVAGDVGAAARDRGSAAGRRRVPASRSSSSPAPNRPSDIRDQRQNTFRDLDQSSFSLSSNSTWLKGAPLDQVRRHLHAQLREGRLLDRRERVEGRVQLHRLRDRQRLRRFPARAAQHRPRAAQHARRPADGHRSRTTGRCSRRTTGS